MIKWVSLDKCKPEVEGQYLVSDGEHVDVAVYQYDSWEKDFEWYLPDMSPLTRDQITHWAIINLPGEA